MCMSVVGRSLATVLKGLLSFMCEDCPTAGAIDPPPPSEERRRLASCSASWNKGQAEFCKAFPEADSIMVAVAARKPQAETGPADEASADAGAQVPAVQETATVDAPEADAAPPATAALEEGAAVRLLGLQKRVDLNGKEGVVRTAAGQDAGGRVTVVVDDEPVSVKPENVERT
ncbi:unnamed protein product [Prorocentrum cordatum]|uniref:Uncharacterized protein n=1 Tax=Prorocentrum cordatum TaxID=2364126 RepID=A0ABN9RE70_9DINO|nr:unnamed protein product [Polarella glacialis]